MATAYCGSGPWAYTNVTTSSSTSNTTWVWNNTCTNTSTNWAYITYPSITYGSNSFVNNRVVQPVPETAESRRIREQRERDAVVAKERAEKLLLEHLDAKQKASWHTKKEINVRSQHGRRYCIEGTRKTHNIYQLNNKGERIKELCVYAGGDIPLEDCVLAQVLSLQFAEDHLLEKANVWDIATGQRMRVPA